MWRSRCAWRREDSVSSKCTSIEALIVLHGRSRGCSNWSCEKNMRWWTLISLQVMRGRDERFFPQLCEREKGTVTHHDNKVLATQDGVVEG
jgi:hypothetical protein